MPEITFIGTGEAFDPDLPNTSLLYRGARTLLVDCGYSVPHAFWRLHRDPNLLDGIYISHVHADHSYGLPALLLWMREMGRSRPIELLGGPGTERWLEKMLELAYPGSSKREGCAITAVEVSPGQRFDWNGLELRAEVSAHSVRNLSLCIREGGRSVAYSGDGAPTAKTAELYRDADLLVHECYSAVPGSDSHANLVELLDLAERFGVMRLAILHFSRHEKQQIHARAGTYAGRVRVLCPSPGTHLQI
jgi:ribonuclease BN (tRNA processing enzyme)